MIQLHIVFYNKYKKVVNELVGDFLEAFYGAFLDFLVAAYENNGFMLPECLSFVSEILIGEFFMYSD